jgi:hypothetical protein
VHPESRPLSAPEMNKPHPRQAGPRRHRHAADLLVRAALAAAVIALSACATVGAPDDNGSTTTTTIPAGASAATTGDRELAAGVELYDKGEYVPAIRTLLTAQEIWSGPIETRVTAQKYVAFSHCLLDRPMPCKAAFGELLKMRPGFELSAAEAGHPQWGAAFAQAKQEAAAGAAVQPAAGSRLWTPAEQAKQPVKPAPKQSSKRPVKTVTQPVKQVAIQ